MDKRRRVVETLKNLVIVALACCALWLVGESQVFQVAGVLGQARQGSEEIGSPNAQDQMVLPVRMAVMSQSGCCAVQYGSGDISGTFSRMAPLLNEGLSSAGEPKPIREEEWERALTSAPGVYFDFQGGIPLRVLTGWLSGGENPNLTATARHLVLTAGVEDAVMLAYRDEDSGQYFACQAQLVNTGHLQSAVAQVTPNGAIFACQAANYRMLAPHTIISAHTPQPREYTASNPLPADEDGRLNQLLDTLSFPLGITTIYETPEGRRARSGNDTLSVSNDGLVTYRSTREEERYPVSGGEGNSDLFAAVDAAAQLVRGALDLWQGESRVCLSRVENRGEGSWQIEFCYVLNDAPVQVGQQGYAAAVLADRGFITEFDLQLRTYTGMEQTTLILPQEQAAAALEELGRAGSQLQLRYQDNGELVQAGWIAN